MSIAQPLPVPVPSAPSPGRIARLIRFAWILLVYNVAVVLWGAVVRATGSGAGCGDHWPLCNGVLVQFHPRAATIIELSHRMTSGITVIGVLALVVWTYLATAKGHLARVAAVAAAVLTFNEALLGALLVLLRLTADNRSAARGVYLSLHLANTLLLLAALALTAHFLARRSAFQRGRLHFSHLPLALVGLGATLAVGVSGSLAALGDTLFPATSLRAALSQDLSRQGDWLLQLRLLHPLSALLAGLFLVWLVMRTVIWDNSQTGNRRLGILVLLFLLLQFGLGTADVLLLAPLGMQIAHLLGADLLWIALVLLAARVCIQ